MLPILRFATAREQAFQVVPSTLASSFELVTLKNMLVSLERKKASVMKRVAKKESFYFFPLALAVLDML